MTSTTLFLLLTNKITIITAANFLVAFSYLFFLFFIAIVLVLTELPNRKIRFLSLGLILSFIAASIGYSLKSRLAAGMAITIGWSYFFFIMVLELCILYVFIFLWSKYEKIPPKSGVESMIGQEAIIIGWSEKYGQVKHNGEVWKAASNKSAKFKDGQRVIIKSIDGLTLNVHKVKQNDKQNSTKKK